MQKKIDFADNMTSWQATKYIIRFGWVIIRNSVNGINNSVKRHPWAAIFLILVASVIVSCVNIHRARSERDEANKALYHLRQQMDSLDVVASMRGGER